MAISKPAGGAATAAGMGYQHRVTAWVAVQILAEKAVAPPPAWDLPTMTTLEWLRCETEEPIDDLLVGTSNEGHIFAQVKHSLTLAQSVQAELASALNQCVRQFVRYRTVTPGQRPWERSLDPMRDRLVLIIGPDSSKAISIHLSAMLMRLRNLVLGCLPEADLITMEARQLLAALQAANAIPSNEPPIRFETWSGSSREEEFLADEGAPIDTEANRKIRALTQSAKEFADTHLNTVPTLAEATAMLPFLQALWRGLLKADTEGVHPKQRDDAWGYLTAACSRLAKVEDLSCEDEIGALIREVLLKASYHAEPIPRPEYDAQFDEQHSVWGCNTARFEAAEGLMILARHSTCITDEVCYAIERLSADPVPSVRFEVASRLNALYLTAPELMWRLIKHFCHEEPRRRVLQGLLSGPMDRLAHADPDQVVSLIIAIYDRIREGPGAREVRRMCVDHFTLLYVWRNHARCRELIFSFIAHLLANLDAAQRILHHLRSPLTYSLVAPLDPIQATVQRRAFDLMAQLLQTAHHELDNVQTMHGALPFNTWPEADQKNTQGLCRLIDYLGMQIYFASGAYGVKTQGGRMPLSPEEQQRFYDEAGSILDELAEVGLPSVAHHLLETLETFIPLDPKGVFLRIGRVVHSGQKGFYEYESLAVGLIVRLVELYLADYQGIFQQYEACRQTLREILDIFVQAGWPEALRLTYRLEEIFR